MDKTKDALRRLQDAEEYVRDSKVTPRFINTLFSGEYLEMLDLMGSVSGRSTAEMILFCVEKTYYLGWEHGQTATWIEPCCGNLMEEFKMRMRQMGYKATRDWVREQDTSYANFCNVMRTLQEGRRPGTFRHGFTASADLVTAIERVLRRELALRRD